MGSSSGGLAKPVDYSSGLSWSGGSITTWSTTLSSFNNTNPNGTWTLYVQDFVPGDNGNIASWSMEMTAVPEPGMTAAIGAVALGGLAVARRFLCRR